MIHIVHTTQLISGPRRDRLGYTGTLFSNEILLELNCSVSAINNVLDVQEQDVHYLEFM